jgi:hypothetical protein
MQGVAMCARHCGVRYAKHVREARIAFGGLAQRDLAGLGNTGPRFIVDVESGKPTMELGKLLDVLVTLGLTLRVVDIQAERILRTNQLERPVASPNEANQSTSHAPSPIFCPDCGPLRAVPHPPRSPQSCSRASRSKPITVVWVYLNCASDWAAQFGNNPAVQNLVASQLASNIDFPH